jgi:membrane-associated phospholipid phosphatase
VPAIVGTFVWLGVRRRTAYLTMRRVFVTAHLATIACYVAFPTAPPRLVPSLGGLTPSAQDAGWHVLQYEFAAVPSGHVVFAAIVGTALVRFGAGWARTVGFVYPVAVAAVTISTANHFVTDAVAGLVVVAFAVEALRFGRDWRDDAAGSTSEPHPAGSPLRSRSTSCPSTVGSSPHRSRSSGTPSSTRPRTPSG